MLTYAEELLLLALDDEKGTFVDTPMMSLEYGLVGALLMELAIKKRIDADLDNLYLVDDSSTEDKLLDKALNMIKQEDETKSTNYWIKTIANKFCNLKEYLLQRLIDKNILKKEKHKILWVFCKRCYPVIDDSEEQEVKTRIRKTILEDEIPDPRDIVLISLIHICNLKKQIFSKDEREVATERIEKISQMDLIAQAVSEAFSEVQNIIAKAISSTGFRPSP